KAGKALQYGRAAHRQIEQYCLTGKLPASYRKDNVSRWVRGVARCLHIAKIEPLRCELPCSLESLRTNVDMVGLSVDLDKNPVLVVVEFKTTSMSQSDHIAYYDSVCVRRGTLGYFNLKNCEREAHRIQTCFGSAALKVTYPELSRLQIPIKLCVIVATATGTVLHEPKSIDEAHFRLGPAFSSVVAKKGTTREKLTAGRTFPPLPSSKQGGASLRSLLARAGHTNIRASRRASALSTMGEGTFSIGIVEKYVEFTETHQQSIDEELRAVAGTKTRPLLILFDRRRGGWALRYL
ncbi:MAG: hypothetical protein ACPHN3_12640, partial [Spongiibacter sp.]